MLADLNEIASKIGETIVSMKDSLKEFEGKIEDIEKVKDKRGIADAMREAMQLCFYMRNALLSIEPLLTAVRVSSERITKRLVRME